MVISSGAIAFGQIIESDYKSSWAKNEITYMMEKGILSGYPDGTFKPKNNMKKSEFYKVINGLMGFENKAQIKFDDVKSTDWYYGEVEKAVATNYLLDTKSLNAKDDITREEVARIIGLVFGVEEDEKAAEDFLDGKDLPKSLKGIIGGLKKKGFIAGYPDGSFRPKSEIKRAEVVKMLYNISGEIVNKAETVKKDIKTNLVVNTGDVVLKDMIIEGDLYLTEGIGEGDVTLDNVEVKGELNIKGGGENSIKIKNSKINKVSIDKQKGLVRVVFENSTVEQVKTAKEVKLELTDGTKIKIVELDGKVDVLVEKGTAIVSIDAVSKEVVIQSEGTIDSIKTTTDVKVNGETVKANTETKVKDGKTTDTTPKKPDANTGSNTGCSSSPSTVLVSGISIIGNAEVGATLTAETTPEIATVNYQWKISTDGTTYTDIDGAISNKYIPIAGDNGKFINLVVTGKGSYRGTATSLPREIISRSAYKVEHYKQNITGEEYTLVDLDTENLTGITGAETSAEAKIYTGFTVQTVIQETIAADGSTVVRINYDRKKYAVKFVDHNDDELKVEEVRYGGAATAPTEPTRTGYKFASWSGTYTNITKVETVVATYTANTDTAYKVEHYKQNITGEEYTLVDSDIESLVGTTGAQTTAVAKSYEGFIAGTVIQETIAADGSTVVRINYDRKKYAVKFVDEDGTTILDTQTVAYGSTPEYKGETPTKEATAEFTYTFTGWTPELVSVTGEAIYTARYSKVTNKYTVKFVDEDGTTVLAEQTLSYGATTEYTGTIPTKAATAEYTYTFTGWTPVLAEVTGDATYKATYSKVTNKYTVKFVDYDDSVLKTEEVGYGGSATEPSNPTRMGYTFASWSGTYTNITKAETVVATYTANTDTAYKVEHYKQNVIEEEYTIVESDKENLVGTTGAQTIAVAKSYEGFIAGTVIQETIAADGSTVVRINYDRKKYAVKFVDEDGTTVLAEQTLSYGATTEYTGTIPTKAATAEFTYTFTGWTPELVSVTGEAIYTARYSKVTNKYTVKFVDEDGTTVLAEQTLSYGATTEYTGTIPTKAATAEYTYTFTGWTPVLAEVTGDATYKATYSKVTNKYTVKFVDYDDSVLKTEEVGYGGSATEPSNPTRMGYTFASWSGTYTNITKAETVVATYTANTDTAYKVEHYKQNVIGEEYTIVESDIESLVGTTGAQTTTVAKSYEGFTVKAFEQETIVADGNTVVKVYYDRNILKVIFNDYDGAELKTEEARYGGDATPPINPTRTGYTFASWNGTYTNITKVETVVATYAANTDTAYKVEHYKNNGTASTISDTDILTGTTGVQTAAEAKTYTGFTAGVVTQETIAADGTTVVKIYYDMIIDKAAIEGLPAPVSGEIPVYTIAGEQYTATILWDPVDTIFGPEKNYKATITLIPKDGYTLEGISENFFTVEGATATNAINAGIITSVFPATEAYKEITDYTALEITLDTDEHLFDLASLKDSSKLPIAVTVTDGTTPIAATITDWTGTFDGKSVGEQILTAVWKMPAGYIDEIDQITVEVKVNVSAAQTNFAGGSGKEGNPYQVSNAEQLDNVRNHLESHFIQTADVNLGLDPWSTGEGWSPIWEFKGKYNGDGKIITKLTINRSGSFHQALFRSTSKEAELKNIRLTDINIKGKEFVGGLVGENLGKISNSYTTGSVVGNEYYTGGLVGMNTNSGRIENSYSTVSVEGNKCVGGLVGKNMNRPSIIENSYATGFVKGKKFVGGLVGWNDSAGIIRNSYAIGLVKGEEYVGGLVGRISNNTPVENSYYDSQTTGQSDTGKGEPKRSIEMGNKNTFNGWDFTEETGKWRINSNPVSYPYLKGHTENITPVPEIFIDIQAIQGVIVPVTEESPVTTITPTNQYTGVVTWNPIDTTFEASKVYTAKIILTANDGYTLKGITEDFFLVDGATTVTNDADSGVITAVFPATASDDATLKSSTYTISGETITGVPFGTSKTDFLAALAKGQENQNWDYANILDPVVSGDTLVVTAEDGTTKVTYIVTVDEAPVNAQSPSIQSDLSDITKPIGAGVTLDITATVNDGGTVSYKWFKVDDANKTNPVEISNQEGASYNPVVDAAGTFYYYGLAINTNESATGDKTAETESIVSKVTVIDPKVQALSETKISGLAGSNIDGIEGNGKVVLTWTPLTTEEIENTGATGYEIYYSSKSENVTKDTQGVVKRSVSDASTGTFTPAAISGGNTLKFVIYAVDGNRNYSQVSDGLEYTVKADEFTDDQAATNLVAAGIKTIDPPEKDATKLILPTVAGYSITIAQSNNESVIANDGTITPPDDEKDVWIQLLVTKDGTGESAYTVGIYVTVPATL